jgi:chromatin remodeling complex protein RSC6
MKVFSKTVRDTMNNFQLELRVLMLQAKKLRKRSSKRSRGNKTPNGFTKTVQVSKEMLQFCGRPVDTESMSRNDVNQFLHKYIRDNNLQDPENKRQIVPDEALKTILDLSKLRTKEEMQTNLREKASEKGWSKEQLDVELSKVTENEHVNYFNLQRLVNHHYM